MRLSGKDLLHFHLSAPGRGDAAAAQAPVGKIGSLVDVYWDDRTWTVRHLVATLGSWWAQHVDPIEVLLDPSYCAGLDRAHHEVLLGMTPAGAASLPAATSDAPRAKLRERRLSAAFAWEPFWQEPFAAPGLYAYPTAWHGLMPPSGTRGGTDLVGDRRETPLPQEVLDALAQEEERADVHLHSLRDLFGVSVRSATAALGTVTDAFVDTDTWRITRLVVDPHPWLPHWLGGDDIVLAPHDIARLDDEARELQVTSAWERAPRPGSVRDRGRHDPAHHHGPT